MKLSLTKTRLVAMGILLLLAGGYAAGAVYLNSTSFRHKLLQQINAAIDGRLTIEGHYLALHSAGLELTGVRLINARQVPLASIKRLRIRLFWPALLRRTLHIKALVVEEVRFHLRYDLADQLQLVKPVSPARPPEADKADGPAWALRIDDFQLKAGVISFERPSKKWSGKIEGLKMAGRMDSATQEGQVEIWAAPLHWAQSEVTYDLPSLNLSAVVDASRAITLKVATPKSELKAWGNLDRKAAGPQLDAACDLNLDPTEFHPWLPEGAGLEGPMSARITARGGLDDPTVTVKADWTKAKVFGVPLAKLEADLRLHRRKLWINALGSRSDWGNVDLTGHVNLQPVFDGGWNFDAAQWDQLTYEMKLGGKDLQPDRIELLNFPADGTFQLRAVITGSGLSSPGARGQAHIDLQASGLSPRQGAPEIGGHLRAEVQRKGPVIELKQFEGAFGGNDLQADARINISAGRIDMARAQFQSARLEELGTLLGIQLPSGTGKVELDCQGPFQQPTVQINLLAQALALDERPLGRLLAQARLNEHGVLGISRMVLENQGSLVEGSGQLTLFQAGGGLLTDPGVALNLAFTHLEPADFGVPESVGSNFNGRIHIGGSVKHLTGKAVLEESALQWGGFAARVQANARWDDGRLTIPDLSLFKEGSSLHLKGNATWRKSGKDQWSAEPHLQAQIKGREIQLQDFFPDYGGTLDLEGRVSGPPSKLEGQFQLSGTDLDVWNQPLTALDIKGRISADKVSWDNMEIVVEKDQLLTSQGWYAFDRSFSVSMAAEDMGLVHLASLQRAYPIDGRLDLRLKATGTTDDPQMDAELTVRNPRLNNQPWDDFHLTAHIHEHRLKLAADLNFNLTADYRLDSGDFKVQGDFDRSDLSPYLAIWAGADWAGVLSGRLQARGNRHRPEQIQGELLLNNTELHYQDNPIISAPQLSVRLKDGLVKIPSARLVLLQNGFVNIAATGRLPNDLRLESDGRLPMAALAPFAETLGDTEGELAFEAYARGPLDKMQWQATLDLIQTGFEIPGLGQQVEALNGHLAITPERLIVKDLSGRLDEGRFNLDGQMQLKKWQPVGGRLTLNAHTLPLQWPDTMDVVLNGHLTFKAAPQTPSLSGQLTLLEGSYYKDVKLNLLSTFTRKKRAVPVPSTYSVPGRLGKTSLNVTVTHRYPLLVDNNLANLQIAPDFKISGTLDRPILSGRAQVVEGEVIFRRKSFEVKQGVVDFINPYKIEPNLDIAAEADIRQWRVSLSLSGPPDQLLFELSSDPAESETDILSLILLGRTSRELTNGEGGSGQTTQQMLASLIATAWGEDVKKQTGMDILEVETGAGEDQESADRMQVTVGKRLSRRLTVKYEVESAGEELVQRAISEYRFLEHLLASGFQDSQGGYGGELVFRIEF